LKPLAEWQSVDVTETRFAYDVERLIRALPHPGQWSALKRWLLPTTVALVTIAGGAGFFYGLGSAPTRVVSVGVPPPERKSSASGWEVVSPATSIDATTARSIQRSLCLPESPNGSFNFETELGLKIYLSVANHKQDDPQWRALSVRLNPKYIEVLGSINDCYPGAKTFYRSWLLGPRHHHRLLLSSVNQLDRSFIFQMNIHGLLSCDLKL
jgi:hypothetical protein